MNDATDHSIRPDGRPIVVTGVAGFIGHHTATHLLDLGWDVIGIDSFTPYYDRSIKERNLRLVEGRSGFSLRAEALTPELCSEVFDGARAVVHLAAQPGVRDSWHDFDTYLDLNVRATKVVLDAAAEAAVGRVVCASSSSVYGEAVQYPTRESAPTTPRSPYGITKLAAERLAVAYGLERGVPTVSLRYFTVYGPGQRPDMAIQRLITAARTASSFPLLGDGRQIRDFTYVADVARANALAALRPDIEAGEVLNVCGGSPVSLVDVFREVEHVTGCTLNFDRHAAALGDVQRTGGSSERVREVLAWSPEVSLADGIRFQDEEVMRRLASGAGAEPSRTSPASSVSEQVVSAADRGPGDVGA